MLSMCFDNTRLLNVWMAIRRMEQWVVTHLSVRLVRVMVLDFELITFGSFSLPSNGVASPTSALVSCT